MAPVTRYVFAEMLGISEHFTAGSHEWLPYSDFSTFPKQYDKHQFVGLFAPGRITVNCQLSILHCPFADRALSELRAGGEEVTPAGQGGEAPGAQVLRLEQALGGAVVAAAAAGGNPGDLILENPVVDPAGNDF